MKTISACIMLVALAISFAPASKAQVDYATNQLTSSASPEKAQRALFPINGSFVLPVATGLPRNNIVDNAAARQLQADKSAFPFLATLPHGGSAVFTTVLKPCGMILPHLHLRATETYVIISGRQNAGIAEENGGRQNLTFAVAAGQSFVVPQGLVHYNVNPDCSPNVFIQAFNNADPGNIGLNSALAGFSATNPTAASAGNFTLAASPQGAFALDTTCLATCGLPATGAPGNGLSTLPQELQAFVGVTSSNGSPVQSPTTAG